jgi:ABC-type amino acid transport substrate-binding protein
MVVYKSIDDAVLALQTGKIDALAVAHGNGEAIISNNPDIAFTGYDFEVDPKYENNVCLLNKNSTELLQKVNAALAKALAAGVYDGWYNDAKALAGISTASEVSYNDDGSAPSN